MNEHKVDLQFADEDWDYRKKAGNWPSKECKSGSGSCRDPATGACGGGVYQDANGES